MKVSIAQKILPRFIRVPLAILARKFGITAAIQSRRTRKQLRKRAALFTPSNIDHSKSKVLVVCAHFNHLKFINDCVDSILVQKHDNWQLVIVDDFSTEFNAIDVLRDLGKRDSRIKVIQLESNSGAYIARNTGVLAADNDWTHVTFIDPDDIATLDFIEHGLEVLGDSQGSVRPVLERWDENFTSLKSMYVGYCPTLHSRGAWERVGGFLSVRVSGDSELISRMYHLTQDGKTELLKGHKVVQKCRLLPGSASNQKLKERKIWLEEKFSDHARASYQELKIKPETSSWKELE